MLTTVQSSLLKKLSLALITAGLTLLVYGLAWTYSTHRYLKGFADAIVPLNGSPLEKSEALLQWLSHQPPRGEVEYWGAANLRDPVNIVQNKRLLEYCGSATNAFVNLAHEAGVRSRRLLLLSDDGNTKHVVAEVQDGERWIVVDPSIGALFRSPSGKPLSKEELRDPAVYQEAITRMPRYNPTYTFSTYAHINLNRIPIVGSQVRQRLDGIDTRWEELIDWGYFPENPEFWPTATGLFLLAVGLVAGYVVSRIGGKEVSPTLRQHAEFWRRETFATRKSA